MPSTSKKQHNFMEAVAHNPGFAKKAGVSQNVGKDFIAADKGRTFAKGGDMATKMDMKKLFAGKETKSEEKAEKKAFPGKAAYKKAEAKYEGEAYAKGGTVGASKMGKVIVGGKKGFGEHSVQTKGLTKGKQVAMKRGGKC